MRGLALQGLPMSAAAASDTMQIHGGITTADGTPCALAVRPDTRDQPAVALNVVLTLSATQIEDVPIALPIGTWRRYATPGPNNDLIRLPCNKGKDQLQRQGKLPR